MDQIYKYIIEDHIRSKCIGHNELVILIRVTGVRLYHGAHVLKNNLQYKYDIQKNIYSEDIIGICGIYNSVANEILYLNSIRTTEILVIADIEGHHIDKDDKDDIDNTECLTYAEIARIPDINNTLWKPYNKTIVFLIK